MKTIGIIYNSQIPEALDLSNAIANELSAQQSSWISPAEDLESLRQRAGETDLVITAGGDGTILRAVRVTAPLGIPIVGINMGRLGFMTELQVPEALERLPHYLNGSCRVEEHNMVQAKLVRSEARTEASQAEGPFHSLNDVVMARGSVSRVLTILARIDGAHREPARLRRFSANLAHGCPYRLRTAQPLCACAVKHRAGDGDYLSGAVGRDFRRHRPPGYRAQLHWRCRDGNDDSGLRADPSPLQSAT